VAVLAISLVAAQFTLAQSYTTIGSGNQQVSGN